MGDADRTVLVTGATGRQGRAVVRHLLGKGWRLRALTPDPVGPPARTLSSRSVEVVRGDLEDPSSLEKAARNVYGIYSVQDFWAVGARREIIQGTNLADAARNTGVHHFVYSSVGGVERQSKIGHWETKWEIEKHIRRLGFSGFRCRWSGFFFGQGILSDVSQVQ